MAGPQQLLTGRRGLIVGIANERSIACGIARAASQHGARLALTFQNERLQKRIAPIANELNAELVMQVDLTRDADIEQLRAKLQQQFDGLDFIVHAVAYADKAELEGRFVETSRAGFTEALDISVYTLIGLVAKLEPLLQRGKDASVVTMTYLGSERTVPNYNVMGVAKAALEASVRYLAADLGPSGIRVNALSAGPIKTLSAAGVRGFRAMLDWLPSQAPLRRNVTTDDVGRAALLLLSELGSGITGEVIHVDAGYNIIGAPRTQA